MYVPDDTTDPGDMVDGIPEHNKVHGLLALAVELSQIFLHGALKALEVLHLFVYLDQSKYPVLRGVKILQVPR